MNNKHFGLGAINKKTNEYVLPTYANKNDKYSCPDCKKDLIFRAGKINIKHFSHKSSQGCNYYYSPNESDIHKAGKKLIKKMLDKKENLCIFHTCDCCHEESESFNISNWEYTNKMFAQEEYCFTYNDKKKYADVALLDGDNIKFIFEIYNTHKTDENDRPSDNWCEIKADKFILDNAKPNNKNDLGEIKIECTRNFICDGCVAKQKEQEEQLKQEQAEQERIDIENKKKQEEQKKIDLIELNKRQERIDKIIAEQLKQELNKKKEREKQIKEQEKKLKKLNKIIFEQLKQQQAEQESNDIEDKNWETEYELKRVYYDRKFDIMWNTNRHKYSILQQKHLNLIEIK
jgi:hypothetical protein